MRTQRLLICAAALALALPATASASTTASVSGTGVVVTGDAANDQVTYGETFVGSGEASFLGVRIENPAGVVPGPGCVPEGSSAAVCRMGTGTLTARLGGGDDSFGSIDGYPLFRTDVSGEGGNDTIATRSRPTAATGTTRCARAATRPSTSPAAPAPTA